MCNSAPQTHSKLVKFRSHLQKLVTLYCNVLRETIKKKSSRFRVYFQVKNGKFRKVYLKSSVDRYWSKERMALEHGRWLLLVAPPLAGGRAGVPLIPGSGQLRRVEVDPPADKGQPIRSHRIHVLSQARTTFPRKGNRRIEWTLWSSKQMKVHSYRKAIVSFVPHNIFMDQE